MAITTHGGTTDAADKLEGQATLPPVICSAASSEQQMLDALSKSVTVLALAIDPTALHGPETEKIVAYENEIREKLFGLLCSLYDDAICQDDKGARAWVMPLVKLLGWKDRIHKALWPEPTYPTAKMRPNEKS
jgi:hypothetical protein